MVAATGGLPECTGRYRLWFYKCILHNWGLRVPVHGGLLLDVVKPECRSSMMVWLEAVGRLAFLFRCPTSKK